MRGHFATGVTVVTAPATPGGSPAGFACQSFSSLSLDPPLVAFMVGRTSTTWPRIAAAGVFCVNVLGAGRRELCRAFAVSGADLPVSRFFARAGFAGSSAHGANADRAAYADVVSEYAAPGRAVRDFPSPCASVTWGRG
ncbi:flavin reductase (DIM6/NTAB) family NADH-FMN oxidoreductase RutF [Streptomyces phaeoluteigriseus]